MRTLFSLSISAALLLPCAASPQQKAKTTPFDGKWLCLRVDAGKGTTSNIVGQVMTIADGNVTWTTDNGGTSAGGQFYHDANANPPRMDINNGVGSYRMDADTLVVYWWATVKQIQATYDVEKQNPRATVMTFRRVKE